ncbi:Methyltransferase domain-containing protein [Candidatus Electrothrix marina]|uniref:Methyltransferase domain-containing protein n=1 Tax=Candidatus Electrothrix marina TaxID=1859130 RepID=A0A444JFU2_9BACT|nr:Methyltransferase domain-containing protein [Candidatus Electrothrix marina]RWX51966.1 Methyltransferase domain-containing protein [Candidatus Electrothrix marina]
MPLTDDTLFNGRLVCRQHRDGYRFSLDAVLLAHFCRPASRDNVLDLGTGCGVISLVLCYRHPDIQVTGLELQPALAELALNNAQANKLEDRFAVQQGDLRTIKQHLRAESYELVLSNPPYHKVGCGRISQEDECALARHELTADPDSVIAAAAYAVKNRGTMTCIYPAERLATVLAAMMKKRLVPKRIQPVYSYPEDDRARLVMIEAMKNGGEGLRLLPPLYIYQYPDGPYSAEVAAMYAG